LAEIAQNILASGHKNKGENSMRTRVEQLLIVMLCLLVPGIGTAVAQQAPARPPSRFQLMSPAYSEGSMIPTRFSCADTNASSPELHWSNPPDGTASFAVIFHDTDAAPGKGTMDVTHWIFWNVPGSSTSVMGGVKPGASPNGIVQGQNIRKDNAYRPPCPPPGATPHHYIFELYALDTMLSLPAASGRAELLKAMDGHVIGKATYVGMFGR
jgi:Raf kinase inhibitor-like YbhB/YbcL family protein